MAPEVTDDSPVELLRSALPDGVVATDPAVVEGYRYDWTRLPEAGQPLAVVRAEQAAHVQTAVRWAARHQVPVVVRGAGTSLAGGASAVEGCLVVSTERMTAIRIDPVNRTAVAEPGALNAAVKDAAAAYGLWYPPDPGSFRISSIGGNVATNAGGICCVKYGVTTDYVYGIDVVLADGRLITLGGRTVKDVAGLPLLKLFVGSEGTLGVITRVLLRLVPQPSPAGTLVAYFDDTRDAARAVVSMGAHTRPSMLELMDSASINAVEDFRPMSLDRDAGALLIGQSDAPGAARADELAAMAESCERAGASSVFVTDDPDEGDMFLEARRAVGPAIDARGAVLSEDICVPVDQLPTAMERIESIARSFRTEIPVFAHAGDGNLHPAIVHRPGDEESRQRALQAFAAILQVALDCGGTITGEHGVGRTKRAALLDQLDPDVMDVARRVRSALDPQGLFNPGVLW
ncbi:FAD-binding oxidoreductase [Modestobacter sp. VKM Ac-2676]|nr:FAD-binding oxidoreductase [Modestobacter sp. VKM Ac-2676]